MRKLTLAKVLLLLAAIAPGYGAIGSGRGPAFVRSAFLAADLSARQRLENFETAWEAIRDNYYDPGMNGVNWDKVHDQYLLQVAAVRTDREFYDLLERMAGELHDAHTHVLSPDQAENFRHHEHVSLGFNLQRIDEKAVVTRVIAESEAARAGVAPGMILESIEGKPLAQKLQQMAGEVRESSSERATARLRILHIFQGEPGTSIKMGFQRVDGSHFEAVIQRTLEPVTPQVSGRLLPSGNAYVSFRVFYPPAAQDFKKAVEQFHDAPGFIIDLRQNPGGSSEQLLAIAGNFFSDRAQLGIGQTRGRFAVPFYAIVDRKFNPYRGPVVVLVGEESASSSELFTAGMQAAGRVKVVGTRTCGCVLGTNRLVSLIGGGQVMISRIMWSTPAGKKLEGEGVIPDKLVPVTLEDIRKGRDAALEEAEALLKEMSPATAAEKATRQ
jgi:carboxyl-terminal processing protease